MSYLVLARKYRPQSFDQVVAQDHVTKTLANALKNDRIGSGYLFCGPRGTGKTTVARILAKSVNCAEGVDQAPCGECIACKEILSGASLDVLEIDAASNTGVDDIRALRENVRYLPASGKRRIYIIDEVHRLSGSAFDALLKTLEEPPPHVMFIFATTEPLKIPETILSRTQRFDFKRVSVEDLSAHLGAIAKKEKLSIEDKALGLLARKADGSVRDSLSLLDQIAAFCSGKITEAEVVNALGLVDRGFLIGFVSAIISSDRKGILGLTQQVFEGGIGVADFVTELLEHLRLLMIIRSSALTAESSGLSQAELDELTSQAEQLEIGDILRLIKIGGQVTADLKAGIDERLLLEVAAVRMAELESTVKITELIEALNQPGHNPSGQPVEKKKLSLKAPPLTTRPTDQPPPPPKESTEVIPRQYSGTVSLESVRLGWDSFLTRLQRINPMLPSQLKMAEVHAVKDNMVELMFFASGATSKTLISAPENFSLILTTIRDHFEADISIRLSIDENRTLSMTSNKTKGSTQNSTADLLANSPGLKSLIDKVDGEIIGIKKIKQN